MTEYYSPLGYVIHSEINGLYPHLTELQPRSLLYMNALAGAKFASDNYPNCRVIHRISRADEAEMHRTPDKVLNYAKDCYAKHAEIGAFNVAMNLQTEPDISRPTDLGDISREHLKVLEWALPRNIKVAVPHLADGGIEGLRWRELDPLVAFIAAHPDLFTFTVDEYSGPHAFTGVGHKGITNNEIGHIFPDTWRRSDYSYPDVRYWHMGRVTWYFDDLRQRGLLLPITVITERGTDALGDITWFRNMCIRTSPYNDIRGHKSLYNQFHVWYGPFGWTPEEAYARMLIASWREIYGEYPNIIAGLTYAWGDNGDRQWDQFRVDDIPHIFRTTMLSYKLPIITGGEMTDKPTTNRQKASVSGIPTTAGLRNIRLQPTSGATDQGNLYNGDLVYYYPDSPFTQTNGVKWYYIEQITTSDDNPFPIAEGWVLGTGMEFTAVQDTEPPLMALGLTEDEMQQFIDALGDWYTAIQSQSDALETVVSTNAAMKEAVADIKAIMETAAARMYP